ncbi:hypothetical protein HYALB_00004481 [Hymenoscyphus albidus]|uniref:Diaminohydroxyphosphoribosylamino-pyrimidine deaminase n=1 Tax=Hymenoscyphus albidus TaxID=595503 RepID=A0A9N9QC87_9HELO|nr:hypothetical protein HYALB_00004481 [Hymenoscyphus albidus]
MPLDTFLSILGAEIEDAEEESFLLFSQSIPSQDLGFVNSKATSLELTIGDRDLVIQQSPTILSSNRGGGTTGAVVWKITPLLASWISSPANILFQQQILNKESAILELGCGMSAIIGLALGPRVASYVLTDQQYVAKLISQNLEANRLSTTSSDKSGNNHTKNKKASSSAKKTAQTSNVVFRPLDWETDEVTASLTGSEHQRSFEVILACDCIYNDALIKPLVQTCIDACKLRDLDTSKVGTNLTVVVVAQQLRSDEVFESWLREFMQAFRVWRMPDEKLIEGLKTDSGFGIHIGVLR